MAYFKFSFEDGSEAIAHYGVKGMHWGVRNPETLARYNRLGSALASKKGYSTVSKEQGQQYLKLVREHNKSTSDLERFYKKHPDVDNTEDKKLQDKHYGLYDRWETTGGNLRDFETMELARKGRSLVNTSLQR